MGSARFAPTGPLRGAIVAPPDKSISHRAALLGAMGEGRCRVERYLDAADTRASLAAVAALGAGVEIEEHADGTLAVEIEGIGLRGARAPARIDVANAGTLIRLIAGWLAGQSGVEFELDGDESIRRRPMGRVVEPLRAMGASISASEGELPPLRILGAPLRGISYEMPVASAQVKSCLLLAGLLAEGETSVAEPRPTRDHTERMLRSAGVEVRSRDRTALPTEPPPAVLTVAETRALQLPDLTVPGDLSSAAFHLVAAALVPGSAVRVEGVGLNPTRVGLLGILNRMQARLLVEETGYQAGEPVGSVEVRHGDLVATRVGGAEVPLAIDELPLLALLGCFAEGETVLTGAEELRHKESDRIAAVVEGVAALGGRIEAREDGFVVHGTGALEGGAIGSGGDHRIAMLGAIAGLASRSGVTVGGIEAAAVSYPGFEADLGRLLGA